MTYVVTEACVRCKYTDCVEVCPVDCFYEGENMLVIHPEECIDCGVCEPECPADAIKPDTEQGLEKWLALNARFASVWPNISDKKEPPSEAPQRKPPEKTPAKEEPGRERLPKTANAKPAPRRKPHPAPGVSETKAKPKTMSAATDVPGVVRGAHGYQLGNVETPRKW